MSTGLRLRPESRTAPLDAVAALATIYPVGMLAVHAAQVLRPRNGGLLGLGQIVIPHLTLPAVVLVPLAFRPRARLLRSALALLGLVFLVRFGREWLSLPRSRRPGPSLHVITWNLEVGSRSGEDAVEALRGRPAELVALQELTPDVAAAIDADPELQRLYPHRAIEAVEGAAGMGVLSRYPIVDQAYLAGPFRQELTLDVDGRRLSVVNGHTHPPRLTVSRPDFDTGRRNAQLDVVRARADEWIAAGRLTLVVGDFNTASTEPAFGRFTAGLADAHAEVGLGPGWTWRPSRLAGLGFGLLRIDLVLGGPGVVPISVGTDCSRVGDHCLVEAHLQFR